MKLNNNQICTGRHLGLGLKVVALLLICAVVFLMFPQQASAVEVISITDLGTLPGDIYSGAAGINNLGQIVGYSNNGFTYSHGFLWENGVMTDIGPGFTYGINDNGQVIRNHFTELGNTHAFLWENGVMTDLGTLPSDKHSYANGINNLGQVVGTSQKSAGPLWQDHAFLWENGVMTDLGTLPGGYHSYATGINDVGQVVGYSSTASGRYHAFLWENGVMTDLGTLGGYSSYARGINNLGQVVGDSTTASGIMPHAFLWENGVMTDLGTLPEGLYSQAKAINDRGQVVGYSSPVSNDYQAFLWENGVMTNLGTLPGGSYSQAIDINNLGQIVGISENHAVIWKNKTIQSPPSTEFIYYPLITECAQKFDFHANPTDLDGDILRYSWDFDYNDVTFDENAIGKKVSWSFNSYGNYKVALSVNDGINDPVIVTKVLTLKCSESPPDNIPPTVDFTYTPIDPKATEQVTFHASASDPDGDMLFYEWNFNYDGVTFIIDATDENPFWNFPNEGTYEVALRVSDGVNNPVIVTKTLEVFTPNQPPTSDFSYNPLDPQTTEQVAFLASAFDPDGDMLFYEWDFNYDGVTFIKNSVNQNPSWTYNHDGFYKVALKISDGVNNPVIVTKILKVSTPSPTFESFIPTYNVMNNQYYVDYKIKNNARVPIEISESLWESRPDINKDWNVFINDYPLKYRNWNGIVEPKSEKILFHESYLHKWQWIKPWQILSINSFANEFYTLLATNANTTEKYKEIRDHITTDTIKNATYAYTFEGNWKISESSYAIPKHEKAIKIYIPDNKINLFQQSQSYFALLNGSVNNYLTTKNWYYLYPIQSYIYATFSLYKLAEDPPDPDYTLIAQPDTVSIPEIEVLPDSSGKKLALASANLLSLERAHYISMRRFEGAEIAGDKFWMAAQMEAASRYSALIVEKQVEINSFSEDVVSELPEITDEMIQSIKDDLRNNGLPKEIFDILSENGFSASQIEEMRQQLLNQDNIYYKNINLLLPELQSLVTYGSSQIAAEELKITFDIKTKELGETISEPTVEELSTLIEMKSQIQSELDTKSHNKALLNKINVLKSLAEDTIKRTNSLSVLPYYEFSLNALAELKLDYVPPKTDIILSGTLGNNNWYTSDVQVNLTAIDNKGGSGVNKTEYSFDNSTWNIYTGPFTVTSEGTSIVYYHSTDNESNKESNNNQTISIDKTPPTITGAATTTPNVNGWYNNDVVVNFTANDEVSGIDTLTPDIVISTEGASQSAIGTANDKAGNSASFIVYGINLDKTLPEITINKPANEYILIQTINAEWLASDSLSGILSATGTTLNGGSIDTSSVGIKSYKVSAEDNSGNKRTAAVTYYVGYNYDGVLQPINVDGTSVFKLGSTIPVKYRLTDFDGNYVSTAVAKIYLTKITNDIIGTEIEATSTSAATTGNLFRYDSTANQYIFNLGTKTLTSGTWQIRIVLDDGSSKNVTIGLR